VRCTEAACTVQPHQHGPSLLLLRGGAPPEDACKAALLVSAEPIRLECPREVRVIDRFTVWREGAHAAWLGPDGLRVISDRQFRGTRPWVLPLPTRNRQPSGVPLRQAPADTMAEES
jgi:competence protein ComEC